MTQDLQETQVSMKKQQILGRIFQDKKDRQMLVELWKKLRKKVVLFCQAITVVNKKYQKISIKILCNLSFVHMENSQVFLAQDYLEIFYLYIKE